MMHVQDLLAVPRSEWREIVQNLTPRAAERLVYDWEFWARAKQLPPGGSWAVWLLQAGRGFGKTRTGAEWIRARHEAGFRRLALVGQTPADVRDVMVEGESGILAISPPWDRPIYEPTRRHIVWQDGGAALCFSGANPDQLRGPQFDSVWVDELAAYDYARETWDNVLFSLRLGEHPQAVVTTTPKPLSVLREIARGPGTVMVRGTSYENRMNLSPIFFDQIISRYEGTRTGRQEIHAELLDEAEGALWKRAWLRYSQGDEVPPLRRIVVAIDPAVSATPDSDETGIIVAGVGSDGRYLVLADGSGRYSPDAWARRAIELYREFRADRIIAEANNGGDMVAATLRTVDQNVPLSLVHASRGKTVRAEPVAALYEQGRVVHLRAMPGLEDQLCTWVPGSRASPDRLDALVWALTELMGGSAQIYL